MKKLFSLLAGGLFCLSSAHATVETHDVTIQAVYTWADNTNGAVLVLTSNNTPVQAGQNCAGGFWFEADNDIQKNMLTSVISAFHAGSTVKLYADASSDFAGLPNKECELKLVIMKK